MTDNPHRLPRSVEPTRYDLVLEPDLAAASFTGQVDISLVVREPTDVLMCNAAELRIDLAVLVVEGQQEEALEVRMDEDHERVSFPVRARLEPGTHATLRLQFAGVLNDKLRGWYRSTYRTDAGDERVIATSQMQATDCRRAFPCWDEPDFKAVFAVTLVVAEDLLAVSNGPEVSRERRPDGKAVVRFADTMPMSSYLVAFVVGPLEATDPVDVDGVPMRIVHVPGKGHLTAFGLDIGAFALRWFQEYYGIPYPAQKVDLLALPDFAAGAMENLGCITFRENLLLVDPATSTPAEEQVVADVVAHELAHMWFGDLVTMRWWNGIWLNEAFATFMEVAACDAFRPDWRRWETFSLERTAAFDVDSLASTRPIEFDVVSPADADGMFDILTYEKGGALLRMLEQYLGEERYRDGIRHYLRTHAYANTETSDLWDALEHVTGEPVRRIMDTWIWQGGYPLVRASLSDDGATLRLRQERFRFAGGDEAPDALWAVPVQVRQIGGGGATQEARVLLDGDEATLPLLAGDPVVVVNSGGHGFYRVAYDDTLRARLTAAAQRHLSTVERYNLVDDTWAAVVAGAASAADFLALAEGFAGETELAVWRSLLAGLTWCDRFVEGTARAQLQSFVRRLVGPKVAELGWDPEEGEADLTTELRGVALRALAVLGADEAAQEEARVRFEQAYLDPTAVDPSVAAAVVNVVAATGTPEDHERFIARFRHASTPQEQLRYLYALAEFGDGDLFDRTLAFALSGEVKTQNAPFLLARAIGHRDHGERAWRTVRTHWERLVSEFPNNTIVRMIDTAKTLTRPEQQADVAAFFAEHDIPQGRKTLEQVLERQRVNVGLRARSASALADALAE